MENKMNGVQQEHAQMIDLLQQQVDKMSKEIAELKAELQAEKQALRDKIDIVKLVRGELSG